ncbi:hypothetical protein OKW21_002162 [Catalinimonas alkaloidigena]|uniref:hypothetical protein n=1 Tax=Catalinimonas alkaloidigena TaxID=1075417 RepID=UPI00240769F4|nr:hypothetical protein [Catalinimonas alkaloidigena]MDF9796899.1 hypothetical protein [Catalinimonas alkaloidigena]
MKKRTARKWIWSILGTMLLVILLLQATLYFFGDEILKESILLGFKRYSEQNFQPDKRPSLDFDNLSINIFTGNFTVTGLYYAGYMSKDSSQNANADHIKMMVHEAKVSGIKFLALYNESKLKINEINFYKPDIQWVIGEKIDAIRLSPKSRIELISKNMEEHLTQYVDEVSFKALNIVDGDLFITQENSQISPQAQNSGIRNKFHAQEVNISLFDFLLDTLSSGRKNRFFFTKDIDIQLANYQFLTDSLYLFKADTLGFSSKKQRIYLKDLALLPLSHQAKNGLSVYVPEVMLTQIDWRDLYFDSLLMADQLIFQEPLFHFETNEDSLSDNTLDKLKSLNLKHLFDSFSKKLIRLQISDIIVNNGQVQLNKLDGDTLNLLHADGVNLLLAKIDFDNSRMQEDTPVQVMPLDTAQVSIRNLKVYLPDRRHYFTSTHASLNTDRISDFACDIHFDSLMFKAGVDSLQQLLQAPPSKPLAFDIGVPKVSFFGVHLADFINKKAAILDSIYIKQPDVKIANFSKQSLGKLASGIHVEDEEDQENVKSLLYDWSNAKLNLMPVIAPGDSSALFQWLKAGRLHIDSGRLHIFKANEDLSGFTQITAIDTFYAYLNDISIDKLTNDSIYISEGKVAVLANEVDIFLQKSKFLLPGEKGEGGMLEVEDMRISTLSNEAYFKNIYFWTNPQKPPSTEVWLHKMYIPYVDFKQVNLKKIYIDQNAEIAKLSVYSPHITLNYKKNNLPKKELKFDFKNLYPQLSSYLNQLSVPNIQVHNAKLRLQKISKNGVEPLFTTQKLNISLRGFFLDSLTRMNRLRPFYADVLDVSAENYQWNFYPEDETYPLLGVRGKSINYNSYEGQLGASQITMLTNTSGRPDLQSLQLYCEKIMADDISPYHLIHDKYLQVGRVMIMKPAYKVHEKKSVEDNHNEKAVTRKYLQPNLNQLLNKNLQKIHLRYVSVEKGELDYALKLAHDTLSFVKVDSIDFKAKDLIVNHQKSRHLHNILYADEIDFSFFADKILSDKSDEGKQKVLIEDAYFSSGDSHLQIAKLQFSPPQNVFEYKDKTHFSLDAHQLDANGLDFKRAYLYGEFKVQNIDIKQSDLNVYLGSRSSEKERDELGSIHELISPYLEEISIRTIQYPQSTLKVYDKKNGKLKFSSNKLKADISDFFVDQSSFTLNFGSNQSATAQMFFSKDINISIQDYSRSLDDGLYIMSAEEVNIESGKSRIEVNGLKLEPQLSKEQMLNRFAYSKSVAKLQVDQLEMEAVDFEALFEREKLLVGEVNIYDPRLHVFKDNRLPRDDTKRPGLYQDLLFNLKHFIKIDQLKVRDGEITYAERVEGAMNDGKISFDKLNLTATNITNDPVSIRDSVMTTLDVSAKVMGSGDLNASFKFFNASENLDFSVNGSLGNMELTAFNQILEPVAFVHIKEGVNQEMKFNFKGDKDMATGKMEFRYNNLSVQMIDKEKGKSGLDEKLGSFIANAFVVKANNPKAVFLRIGNIENERDKSRAMFHYWWKSLLSGVKSSIGLEKNMEKTKDFAELEKD